MSTVKFTPPLRDNYLALEKCNQWDQRALEAGRRAGMRWAAFDTTGRLVLMAAYYKFLPEQGYQLYLLVDEGKWQQLED